RHPGELISRDRLRRELWQDETFVDFDQGVNFCVSQIRAVLGDSADSPRYIETLPRRGYRFIGAVAAPLEDRGRLATSSDPTEPGAPRDENLPARAVTTIARSSLVPRWAAVLAGVLVFGAVAGVG